MDAQPFLKQGQIKLMPAQLRLAIEQHGHIPTIAGLERRILVDIHQAQDMTRFLYQFSDMRCHVFA